jgi:hypothetical protein
MDGKERPKQDQLIARHQVSAMTVSINRAPGRKSFQQHECIDIHRKKPPDLNMIPGWQGL